MSGLRSSVVFTAALAFASCTFLVEPSAHAEPSAAAVASAKALVTEGRKLREDGDHKGARDRFKAAYANVPTPIIGLDLAREHVALAELLEAREVCLEVVQLPKSSKESTDGAKARDACATLAQELAGRIPELTIAVEGPPKITKVVIDGEGVAVAALAGPRKINPGSHAVVLSSGTTERRFDVSLKEGERRTLSLEAAASAATPPPGPDPSSKVKPEPEPEPAAKPAARPVEAPAPAEAPRRDGAGSNAGGKTLAWVSLAVGGAGLAVGSVTGLMSLSKTASLKDECIDKRCPPSSHATFDSATSLGTISTIGFVAGGVGVGAFAFFYLSGGDAPPKTGSAPRVTAMVGPGSFFLQGAF